MSSFDKEPLPLGAVRSIDQLCDRFEAALKARQSPQIEEFLSLADEAHRSALLEALLEVELEYRRAWGEQPSADEYLERFPDSTAVRSAFEQRAWTTEAPGDEVCLVQMALANASGRRIDRLRIYFRGSLVHTTTLSGALELGRQRQGEAPPFAVTQGQLEPRLVIAPLDETTISRRHLRLIPEGENHIRVANLSRVNPILFADGRRLEAEQSEAFPLTLEMTLGAMFLRIDRPSQSGDSGNATEVTASGERTERLDESEPPRPLLERLWNWGRTK
jgi:hypothetical protein